MQLKVVTQPVVTVPPGLPPAPDPTAYQVPNQFFEGREDPFVTYTQFVYTKKEKIVDVMTSINREMTDKGYPLELTVEFPEKDWVIFDFIVSTGEGE